MCAWSHTSLSSIFFSCESKQLKRLLAAKLVKEFAQNNNSCQFYHHLELCWNCFPCVALILSKRSKLSWHDSFSVLRNQMLMFYGVNLWCSMLHITSSAVLLVMKSWAFIFGVVLFSYFCVWTVLKALVVFNFKILSYGSSSRFCSSVMM